MKNIVLGASSPEISKREIDNHRLAKEVAAESMVLLKNDNVLPLSPGRIALYGAGSRMTVSGGAGSGDTRARGSINIEQGLKNAGFEIANESNLSRFENQYKKKLENWKQEIEKKASTYSPLKTMDMFIWIGEQKKPMPGDDEVLPEDIIKEIDTAIYVLARQAGEGGDRKAKKGDYYLSDVETEGIKRLSENYEKLILVINSGGIIDLSILDECRVDAVIFYGQAGVAGGEALADIITGKVNPSGHLSDTWAFDYFDYPGAAAYSHLNGDVENENYCEGSLVGYRYFSALGKKVRYPFGYGLSYTNFSIGVNDVIINKSVVHVSVTVLNAGDVSGKEVVQLYLDGELVAFAKTKLLQPKESQKIELCFDFAKEGKYDTRRHSFVLRQGDYGLSVGNQYSDDTFAVLSLDKEVMTEECFAATIDINFDELSETRNRTYDTSIKRYVIDSSKIETIKHKKYKPTFSKSVEDKYSKLMLEEKVSLVVGGGYSTKCYNNVMGAAGRTAVHLMKKGIPNIILSDGPAGLNVVPEIVMTKIGIPMYPNELPEDWQWGWLKKISKFMIAKPGKGRPVYRYMTQWPCATLQAQSFNTELIGRVGTAIGQEMLEIGVAVWLAPGMNIHRNPLCGRNFEYYSEDPLLSGKMAAAVTSGVQSNSGVGVSIKHFCCNNQEENRMMVSENLSEKALREIYLKGFRIAIEEGKPWTVMSSYNKINGLHVCNSKALLIGVLRDEWGFSGLVMSDWNAVDQCSYECAIEAGNDLIMPGAKKIRDYLLALVKAGKLDEKDIEVSAKRVLELIFASDTTKKFYKGE